MPNWCSNFLSFSGEKIGELKALMEEGEKYNNEFHQGWAPPFLTEPDKYLFDIMCIEIQGDELTFRCESKWAPPEEEFKAICEHFGLDGIMSYEEMGMGIYGRCFYSNGEYKDVCLDQTEMDLVEYDMDNDVYRYKGQEIDSQYEIYEELLESKIEKS